MLAEFFVDPEVPANFYGVLDRINHPELPTIYGPTTQGVFLLGYWLRPGSIVALQTLLTLVDFATIGLLLSLASAGQVMLRLVSAGGQGSRLHRPPGRPWRVSGTGRAGAGPIPALGGYRGLPGTGRGRKVYSPWSWHRWC